MLLSEKFRHMMAGCGMSGRLRARLFQAARVFEDRATAAGGWELMVELPRQDYERLLRQEPGLRQRLETT
jgi:hypothetical protein